MVARPKLSVWIPIILVIIGFFGGAGAWAVASHDGIEARAEARVLRSEDRVNNSIVRIERKLDFIIETLIGR